MEPLLTAEPPSGWGQDAADYLAARGLIATEPLLRASDYGTDPFTYYLTRRLRITSALRYSTALTRGSWFHLWAEHDWDPSPQTALERLPLLLDARHKELKDICTGFGIVGDSLTRVLLRETRDYQAARAYHDATSLVPVDQHGRTIRDIVTGPNFELLGVEVECSYTHPTYGPTGLRADALLLHKKSGALWILDRKTTAYSPRLRASLCPEEMQTWHYLITLRELLKSDDFRRKLGLPPKTPLGGMIHDITQKCPLNFAPCDRDFTLDTSPFKTGPRKGQPRNEKTYFGEPRFENYLARVRSWYLGTDEYESLKPDRESLTGVGPPCNISTTSTSILDDNLLLRYNLRLASIHSLATRTPHPINFLSTPANALPFGKATPLTPFYLLPPRDWPDAMTQGRLLSLSPTERNLDDDTDTSSNDQPLQ